MQSRHDALSFVLGILGAIVGGAIGHFAFVWIVGQGFYALLLPGAALGLGFSIGSRGGSFHGALLCGIAAVPLAMFSEWTAFPFVKDDGFLFFVTHVHQLQPITLIMIGLGALCAFWIAGGTSRATTGAQGG